VSTYYPQITLNASMLFDNNANISGYKLRPKMASKSFAIKELTRIFHTFSEGRRRGEPPENFDEDRV
jgi:hypothetical protein